MIWESEPLSSPVAGWSEVRLAVVAAAAAAAAAAAVVVLVLLPAQLLSSHPPC